MPDILLFRFFHVATVHAGWMIAIAIVVWIVLLVKAVRRSDGRRLPLRLALTTVAVAGLLLAGLQPSREVKIDPGAAILLTPGADPAVVDSLRQAVAPELTATFDSATAAAFPRARLLTGVGALLRHHEELHRIHLVGSGLNQHQREQLTRRIAGYYLAALPAGVIDFHYTEKAIEGEPIKVSGNYHQTQHTPRRLFLESPNGKELLLASDSSGTYVFSLETKARQQGRYLFHLVEENDRRQVLHRAPLPVLIAPGKTLRVLLLNDAPSFETRYLKNWLADEGYPVAVRSTISRDKYQTEFSNLNQLDLFPIRKSLLNNFDLIIAMEAAVQKLSPGERRAMREAIEGGLGLVVLGGKDLPGSGDSFISGFPLSTGAPLFLPEGDVKVELEKAPYNLREAFGFFPLIHSSTGKIVAASRLQGSGRITLQLAAATYRLLLAGHPDAYARHWTTIIEATSQKEPSNTEWHVLNPLEAMADQPLNIRITTSVSSPTGQIATPDSNASAFFLQQDPLLPDRWSGVVWPRKEGWHRFELVDHPGDSAWTYVPPADAWEPLRQYRQQEATRSWMTLLEEKAETEATVVTTTRPYPLWIFYLVFLFSAGGLWLEEKWEG